MAARSNSNSNHDDHDRLARERLREKMLSHQKDSDDNRESDGGTDGGSDGSVEVSSEALAEYIGNLIGSSPYTHEANIEFVIKSVQEGTFKIPPDSEVVFQKDEHGKVVKVTVEKKQSKNYAQVNDTRFAVSADTITRGQSTKKHQRQYTPEELKKKYPPSPWRAPTPRPPGT